MPAVCWEHWPLAEEEAAATEVQRLSPRRLLVAGSRRAR